MFLGNIQANNFFLGPSQVNEIWLGNLRVWQRVDEWECVIDNINVFYFDDGALSGDSLLPDTSNYATVSGRVRIYKNGELETNYNSIQLDVSSSSDYVTIVDGDIEFNISRYGTTNMATMSNPFYVTLNTSFSGYTGPQVQVSVTPNLITSTEVSDFTNYAVTSVSYLAYNQTSFTVTNKNQITNRTNYSSGKYTTATSYAAGYLYEVDEHTGTSTLLSTMAANGSTIISIGTSNTWSYPRVFVYRLSNREGTTGYDDFIYMMQKSSSNTSGLQLYWGSMKVNNGTTLETSTFFYLANNGHTNSTTYAWSCDDSSIEITQEGGVFLVENVTSSSDFMVTISDNNGNSVTFDVIGS